MKIFFQNYVDWDIWKSPNILYMWSITTRLHLPALVVFIVADTLGDTTDDIVDTLGDTADDILANTVEYIMSDTV